MVKNTPLTLSPKTLSNADSGCVSNFAPHVAPALANKISTLSVCFWTSDTSRSISLPLLLSAGTLIAIAFGALFGSALSAATASSHALAFLEVMKTLEHPACKRLWHHISNQRSVQIYIGINGKYPEAACKPSPLEPPVTTATFPSRRNKLLKSLSSACALASEAIVECLSGGSLTGYPDWKKAPTLKIERIRPGNMIKTNVSFSKPDVRPQH